MPAAGGAKEDALRRPTARSRRSSTRTELEALLLENTLIKKHRPRYNVCLRDDKTYPYIKITTGEAWPRALVTRRVQEDGHSYFGPFWGGLARRIMRMITRHFQIRTCTIEIDGKLPRPCLYYDLHACLGPCVAGLTTREAYAGAVADVVLFLQGRNRELEASLTGKMQAASDAENFEMAAAYRDALRTVQDVAERQVVQSLKGENVDVFGFFESGQDVAVCVLVVRGGVLQDRRDFFFEKSQELDPAAFLEAFLPQFYDANPFLPAEVHLPVAMPGRALLEEFLAARRGARVAVRAPQRGPAAERRPAWPRSTPASATASGSGGRAATRRSRSSGWRGPIGLARPAAAHRGLRHFPHPGHRQRRVARGLRGRQAEEVGLPPLQRRRNGQKTRPIRASSSPRSLAPSARPAISTKRSTALAATWRTGSKSVSSISMPIAPRPPPCGQTSCGCGSPRWPNVLLCALRRIGLQHTPFANRPAAPFGSSCSRSAPSCA